jgi:hypothetical protein
MKNFVRSEKYNEEKLKCFARKSVNWTAHSPPQRAAVAKKNINNNILPPEAAVEKEKISKPISPTTKIHRWIKKNI